MVGKERGLADFETGFAQQKTKAAGNPPRHEVFHRVRNKIPSAEADRGHHHSLINYGSNTRQTPRPRYFACAGSTGGAIKFKGHQNFGKFGGDQRIGGAYMSPPRFQSLLMPRSTPNGVRWRSKLSP